jgi:hypothetical protein
VLALYAAAMAKSPEPRTPEKLRAFAEQYVLYEVEMLQRLTVELIEAVEANRQGRNLDELYPVVVRNAIVESFGIRSRLLTDFIYGYGTHEHDVFAKEYVDGPWEPAKVALLEEARTKANKAVAHLSYLRLLDEGTGWNFGDIWLELARLLREFAAQADPDRLAPEVAQKIIELVEPIDGYDAFHMAASNTQTRIAVAGEGAPNVEVSQDAPKTPVSDVIDQVSGRDT